MGISDSKLEKQFPKGFPANERYFGLENFGNTCYCNSVLQALYFCLPFRMHCLHYITTYKPPSPPTATLLNGSSPKSARSLRPLTPEDPFGSDQGGSTPRETSSPPEATTVPQHHFLYYLSELFTQIYQSKARTGCLPPKKLVLKLYSINEIFRSVQHQDAHEFLMFLLNTIDEILQQETQPPLPTTTTTTTTTTTATTTTAGGGTTNPLSGASSGTTTRSSSQKSQQSVSWEFTTKKTFVRELFEGILTSETRCLTCETTTQREEQFFDLSLEIFPNASLSSCVRQFLSTEILRHENKFFCATCGSLQEAQKGIRIKRAPRILIIHLKRFKYVESQHRHKKLTHRVAFSSELRLPMATQDSSSNSGGSGLYHLFGIVVHIGIDPNMGHYVSLVKSQSQWFLFDDDYVESIPEHKIPTVFGSSGSGIGGSGSLGGGSRGDVTGNFSSSCQPHTRTSTTSPSDFLTSTSSTTTATKSDVNFGTSTTTCANHSNPNYPSSSTNSSTSSGGSSTGYILFYSLDDCATRNETCMTHLLDS